jgi:hypothetical protein
MLVVRRHSPCSKVTAGQHNRCRKSLLGNKDEYSGTTSDCYAPNAIGKVTPETFNLWRYFAEDGCDGGGGLGRYKHTTGCIVYSRKYAPSSTSTPLDRSLSKIGFFGYFFQ